MPGGRTFLVLFALGAVTPPPAPCAQKKNEPPPTRITIESDRSELVADGLSSARITAHYLDDMQGVAVRFTASGGLLSSSAVNPVDGVATVDLVADREVDLGRAATKQVIVRATVELTDSDVVTATTVVTFRTPGAGAPLLFLEATPAAAVADGQSQVTVRATARRLNAGTTLHWSTDRGTLSAPTSTLALDPGGDVATSVTLTAPATLGNAQVTVRETASGAQADLAVNFVPPGTPPFDLTGIFAEYAIARVRLTANTLTPNPQCITAPSIIRMDVTQNDANVHVRFTTCFVTLPPVTTIAGTVTNETPPPFIRAIPAVEQDFTLPSTALGTTFAPPQSVVVVGAELSDPANDALPTSASDARVRDSDGDGQPGVTVINSLGGEQHVVYRNKGGGQGKVASSNRIVGTTPGDLVAVTETAVLGAGNQFMPRAEGLPGVLQFVRIDGLNGSPDVDANGDGEISCQEITDAQLQIFDLVGPATPLDCGGL